MTYNLIESLFKPLGLYKPKNDYLESLDEKIEKISADFDSLSDLGGLCSNVIEELNKGNIDKATEEVLKFCKINDEVQQLREIKENVKKDRLIAAAISVVDAAALIDEIIESTSKEITACAENVQALFPDIELASSETAKKLTYLKSVSADWTIAEKLGTPAALRMTADKLIELKNSITSLKTEMNTLAEKIAAIKTDNTVKVA